VAVTSNAWREIARPEIIAIFDVAELAVLDLRAHEAPVLNLDPPRADQKDMESVA